MTSLDGAAPATRESRLRVTLCTSSATETQSLAARLATVARAGDRLALVGPLGAGKTQFAKGFAVGLDINDVVNSPSYALMSEYEGRLSLFHQDLYRLAGADDVLAGGLLDERQDVGVTLTEWADRIDDALDPERLTIRIDPTLDETREIVLEGRGEIAQRYATAARSWEAAGP